MPLYEYLCRNCANRFERIVKFSDPPLTVCPKCGQSTIDQMISAPAVQFKGSGWYVTDYAKKNPAGATSSGNRNDSGESFESSASAATPAGGESTGAASNSSSESASGSSSDTSSNSAANSKSESSKQGSSSSEGSNSSAPSTSGAGTSASSGAGDSAR